MAGMGGRRRGLGFGAGVITGLAFSAVVLTGLSLSVPLGQPQREPAPGTAPAPEDEAARPETAAAPGTAVIGEPGPAADEAPAGADTAPAPPRTDAQADEEPVAAPDGAGSAPPARQAAPGPETAQVEPPPVGPEPVGPASAVDESPPPEQPVADAVEAPAGLPADPAPAEPPAAEPPAAEPPAAEPAPADLPADPAPEAEPARPAWRANAAMADLAPDVPVMTVIVTGARAATLPALTTLAPLSAVTVAIDPGAEDRAGLATALRALGHEVLETVPADAPAQSVPLSAGLAVPGVADMAAADAVLAAAESSGALAVDLLRGAASPLVEAGRAAGQPVAGAALRITAARTATEAFQTLRDAGALAAQEGTLVVALEASPTTLTALGRWLALPGDVQPAPLTALIGRLGATRY